MICLLDGRQIADRSGLHDLLVEKLELPDYYGRNLDALYDLLTERREELALELIHVSELRSNLGCYADAFLNTLKEAAENNPVITVKFFDNFSKMEN